MKIIIDDSIYIPIGITLFFVLINTFLICWLWVTRMVQK